MKKLISMVLALVLMVSLVPSALAADSPRVTLSSQNLTVNGEAITGLEIYNIDGSNYFKLRDVAYLLNGTASQFDVTWDASHNAVVVELNKGYHTVGGECVFTSDKSSTAKKSTQLIYFGMDKLWRNESADISAYNIGGNNYLKLRDLLSYTTATVDWDASTNTIVVSTQGVRSTADMSDFEVKWRRLEGDDVIDAALAARDEIYASGAITSSSNQRQIAKAYYDWLTWNVAYDSNRENGIGSQFRHAMLDRSTYCGGYATAFQFFLGYEGIECEYLTTESSNYGHAYNRAVLDGKEVYIDVTNGRVAYDADTLLEGGMARAEARKQCAAWLGFGEEPLR